MSQTELAYLLTLPTNATYSEWSLIGSSCQHIHTTYIHNDDFLLILHLITLVSTVFNFTGIYCILTKSNETMGMFKWCLANLQFWIVFTDLWVTVLIAPRFYFPVVGGRALGVLYTLGLTVPQLLYLGSANFGCMIASVFILFLYRHQVIVSSSSVFKVSKTVVVCAVAFNYLFYCNMALPVLFTVPENQIDLKVHILKNEKCPPKDILDSDVYILLTAFKDYIPYACILIVIVGAECGLMAVHSSWCLFFSTLFQKLSKKTRKMQAKFLLALFAQIAIPTTLCYAPIFYAFITTLIDHYNQLANDICVFVFVTHGMISSLCLLLFYDCYFNFLKSLLGCNRLKLAKRSLSVSQVDILPTRNNMDMTNVMIN